MARFFINRPIVAMVIAVLTVLVGLIALVRLPISLYPEIAPSEILLTARYPGANAVTVGLRAAKLDLEPMIGVTGSIPENCRLTPGVEYHDISESVVVQIVKRGPTTAELRQQPVAA